MQKMLVKSKKLRLMIVAVVLGLTIIMTGCGGNNESDAGTLIGRWQSNELSNAPNIEFFSDGTGRSFDEFGNELIVFTWETGSSTLLGSDDILIIRDERSSELNRGTFEVKGSYLEIQWFALLGSGQGRSHGGNITYLRSYQDNAPILQEVIFDEPDETEENQTTTQQDYAEIPDDDTPAPVDVEDTSDTISIADWITIGNMISIPPAWSYDTWRGVDVYGYGVGDELIVMEARWLTLEYFEHMEIDLIEDFIFNDGNLGAKLITSDAVYWLNRYTYVVFWFGEGRFSRFADNEELITAIAKTLTGDLNE